MGWQISNPEATKEEKKGCLDYLINAAEEYGRSLGYDVIFTTSNVKPVVEVFNHRKYTTGDVGVDHYLKQL